MQENCLTAHHEAASSDAEAYTPNAQPCKTIDFHDYWRTGRTEAGQVCLPLLADETTLMTRYRFSLVQAS